LSKERSTQATNKVIKMLIEVDHLNKEEATKMINEMFEIEKKYSKLKRGIK